MLPRDPWWFMELRFESRYVNNVSAFLTIVPLWACNNLILCPVLWKYQRMSRKGWRMIAEALCIFLLISGHARIHSQRACKLSLLWSCPTSLGKSSSEVKTPREGGSGSRLHSPSSNSDGSWSGTHLYCWFRRWSGGLLSIFVSNSLTLSAHSDKWEIFSGDVPMVWITLVMDGAGASAEWNFNLSMKQEWGGLYLL